MCKGTPRFSDSPGGAHKTQHLVLLPAVICTVVKGHREKSAEGKRACRESQRKPGTASKSPFPAGSYRARQILPALNHDNMCEMLFNIREAH